MTIGPSLEHVQVCMAESRFIFLSNACEQPFPTKPWYLSELKVIKYLVILVRTYTGTCFTLMFDVSKHVFTKKYNLMSHMSFFIDNIVVCKLHTNKRTMPYRDLRRSFV